jgi:hypothetical protein
VVNIPTSAGVGIHSCGLVPVTLYVRGDELEYVAIRDAARDSLRLLSIELAGDQPARPRRGVVAADSDDAVARPDLEDAAGRVSGSIPASVVAAVHIDDPKAEYVVRQAADVVDAADLGDRRCRVCAG